MVYMTFAVYLLLYTARCGRRLLLPAAQRRVLTRMLALVGVFVLFWGWPLAARLYELAHNAPAPHWLLGLHGMALGGVGMANAAIWAGPIARSAVLGRCACKAPAARVRAPRLSAASARRCGVLEESKSPMGSPDSGHGALIKVTAYGT
jgi:hypothetical protein